MNAIRCSSLTAAVLGCSLIAASSGCVSSSKYDLAKANAENAKLLYQNEAQRSSDLTAGAKQIKRQIEDLEASLRDTRERLARGDREWRETRDELLRLKIEREQTRRKGGERVQEFIVHSDTERPMPAIEAESLRSRTESPPDDPKRRLKELLQQLQSVLDHL